MDQQDKQLESLHEQASTLYLQGEYASALQTWRELLKLDPKDERAREGARLCQLLVGEQGASISAEPAAPTEPAPRVETPSPPPAVGFGMGEDLDQSLDELDELLGDGSGADWMNDDTTQSPPSQTAAIDFDLPDGPEASPDRQGESAGAGFQMSKPEEVAPSVSVEPDAGQQPPAFETGESDFEFNFEATDQPASNEEPSAETTFEFGAGETAADEPAGDGHEQPAETAASAATAEELQNRTNELMAEAMESYERGEHEKALAALSRLEILDENNEAAQTFAAHIRAEIQEAHPPDTDREAAPEPQPEPEAAAADDTFAFEGPGAPPLGGEESPELNHQPIDLGTEEAEGLSLGGSQTAEAEASQVAEGAEFDEEIALIEGSIEGEQPGTAAAAAKTGLANKYLWIAAVVLLLLGGGFAAMQFVGGGSESAEPQVATLAVPPPLGAQPNDGAPAQPVAGSGQAGDAPPSRPVVSEEEIQAILQRGEAEFTAGNYAAAVLAFNEVIKLDPQNAPAKRRLQEAGDLYREQKAQLEQRSVAIQAFNDGDYRNALRLFYRLPSESEEQAQRFNRYKRNGWYNMGLRALMNGDCKSARSDLREAQTFDSADAGVRYALELTAACYESQSQEYFDSVRALSFRGLDD
jgi:tetratricopeptide (TPR) repeat protein